MLYIKQEKVFQNLYKIGPFVKGKRCHHVAFSAHIIGGFLLFLRYFLFTYPSLAFSLYFFISQFSFFNCQNWQIS